jgi:hypothetical protein
MGKKIIVNQHKHGTDYYDASSPEVLKKSLLKLFKTNKRQSFYWMFEDTEYNEEIESIHSQISKNNDIIEVLKKHKDNFREEEAHNQALMIRLKDLPHQKKLYDQSLKGSTEAILAFLKERSDYSYEGFELVNLMGSKD